MPASTSLSLRALFRTAAGRAGFDRPAPRIAGLTPAARGLYLAGLAHQAPRDVVIAVVASDAEVEQLVADTRFFLAALEGLGEAAVTDGVLPLPSHEIDPYRGLAPHLHVASERTKALVAMAVGDARVVVASATALLPRLVPPVQLAGAVLELKTGSDVPFDLIAEHLVQAGFTREDPVDEHGEFSVRGGILDVFPAGERDPVRVEFVGDTVESIRQYDAATQRSTVTIDQIRIVPIRERLGQPEMPTAAELDLPSTAFEYFSHRRRPSLVVVEPEDVDASATRFQEQVAASFEHASTDERRSRPAEMAAPEHLFVSVDEIRGRLARAVTLEQLAVDTGPTDVDAASADKAVRQVRCQPAVEFRGRMADWMAEVRRARDHDETVVFVADSPGRAERMLEIARDYQVVAVPADRADEAHFASLIVTVGHLSRGFRLREGGLALFAEADVFEEERRAPEKRRQAATRTFLSDLRDLKIGDHVVHVDHGIGTFVGLRQLGVAAGDAPQEFMELRYAGDDKLFVPVERLDLVQKYSGAGRPPLDRLGGTSWEKAKTRVRKAMRDMAEELLKLYAARKAVAGFAFSPDSHWQQEFEDAFPYELTPDQRAAIADIKADMEAPTPMDRLLCGDVGYGKTEVAMRAAFKAVMDGKQVAVLAPTTVLAAQHLKTLRERFAGFPVRVEMISRFRSRREHKTVLEDLTNGRLEIIVGTHRLLSKDVQFRDLGLLVVDEEQRFGVAHKEKIKQLKKRVDVLTMTATPIPRTLNMSLVGIRDMSIIETPPKDRLSIQTHVVKFDAEVIRRAILHELERGGQVYVVHNRVESIHSIGNLVARLAPEARLAVGHGQMNDDVLEKTMMEFMAHRHDVLVATTIVENGLDIPNANTIIINRADRYGLSQLYQLRGRVGRSDRPAYAYLLIPPEDSLSPVARKRLAAIREFSDLGSGFRVAALDLEIRGAGNLLGGEQSGQMEAVGFEMYMKLLEETVRQLKGEEIEDDVRATVNLRVDLKIDEGYIPDMNQRLSVYRRVASARTEDELERAVSDVRDRYGALPESLLNLADYGRIRVLADQLGIEGIDREAGTVVFRFRGQTRVDPASLVGLVGRRADVTLVPPAGMRLDLGRQAPPRTGGPAAGRGRRPRRGGTPASDTAAPASWWTTRATAGEVAPGFSRSEILRSPAEDPRGPSGVFTRVGGLLSELLESL